MKDNIDTTHAARSSHRDTGTINRRIDIHRCFVCLKAFPSAQKRQGNGLAEMVMSVTTGAFCFGYNSRETEVSLTTLQNVLGVEMLSIESLEVSENREGGDVVS